MANWAKLQEDLVGLPVAKRAKHGIHFQKSANEFIGNFSGKPCHYEDGGIWKPIDTKLVLLPDGFYGCPHSKVKVHPDGRVAVAGTDYAQRVELPSAKTGLADGDKLIREFSFGKQEMRITEDGFRSEITLNRIPTLTEARKLIASESGTLSKKYLKSLTTATDANGDTHTFTTLTAFRTWLASAVFPVVIDPDFASSTTYGYIRGANADYATARATSATTSTSLLYVGQYQALTRIYRSFIYFDTSSIADGETINQVNLTMTIITGGVTSSPSNFDIQIVKQNWSAPLDDSRESNYDGCLAGTADVSLWRAAGAFSTNTPYASGNLSTDWVNKTGNTYYSLRSDNDFDGDGWNGTQFFAFGQPDHATESYRPVLTVTYTAGGTFIPINFSAQMQNLSGNMRG